MYEESPKITSNESNENEPMRLHIILNRLAKSERWVILNAGDSMGDWDPHTPLVGVQIGVVTLEIYLVITETKYL